MQVEHGCLFAKMEVNEFAIQFCTMEIYSYMPDEKATDLKLQSFMTYNNIMLAKEVALVCIYNI